MDGRLGWFKPRCHLPATLFISSCGAFLTRLDITCAMQTFASSADALLLNRY